MGKTGRSCSDPACCIDLMHRTMIAVSEGRVVLPLRSILVMPGDRGMMGMMIGQMLLDEHITQVANVTAEAR